MAILRIAEFSGGHCRPIHHSLARRFVTLDNFLDSGEVSGVGWNWSVAARTTDYTEKTVPPEYAGRGFDYSWEGTNRGINVGIGTLAGAQEAACSRCWETNPDPDPVCPARCRCRGARFREWRRGLRLHLG